MGTNGLRILPVEILSGLTEVSDTPRRPPKGSGGLKHYQKCDLAVNLPPALNFSQHHQKLVKYWLEDWGDFVGGCSEGDFAEALVKGTSLGHVFAETIWRIVDRLSMGLGSGFVKIGEKVELRDEEKIKDSDARVVYRISIFYEERFQFSIAGVENLTTGYLNDIILGERQFDIHVAIRGMIDYRLAKPSRPRKKGASSRRPRHFRKRTGQQPLTTSGG
jgi:hypothetical protein